MEETSIANSGGIRRSAEKAGRAADWIAALVVAAVAAALYLPAVVDFAAPGISAALSCEWLGLSASKLHHFPLAAAFAKPLGAGNAIAPICGIAASVLLYALVSSFIKGRTGGEYTDSDAALFGRVGGATAAIVFMFSPAVFESATHLEPRLFDAAWALAAFALAIPYASLPKGIAWTMPLLAGVMAGAGLADTADFLWLAPLYLGVTWAASKRRGGRGYGAAAVFLFAALAAMIWARAAVGDFDEYVAAQKAELAAATHAANWYVVALFAFVPALVALFAGSRAFGSDRGLAPWIFHGAMTLVAVLAIATSLSPSAVLKPTGVPPALACAFAAFTSGYVMAYWWSQTKAAVPVNESTEQDEGRPLAAKGARAVGLTAAGFFGVVALAASVINRCVAADPTDGAFAEKIADRVVAEMGDREWLVAGAFRYYDGTGVVTLERILRDQLLLAAHKAGKDLTVVSLNRDDDMDYIDELAAKVEEKKLGGEELSKELADTLRRHPNLQRRRVELFLQKWFAADPDVKAKVAVLDAPDLWFNAKPAVEGRPAEPVAETYFFGGDPAKEGDWSKWGEIAEILKAEKGWGSFSLFDADAMASVGHLEKTRLQLRRHLGLVATDRGYWWHERGLDAQELGKADEAAALFDKAFAMYELVLNEIDSDNICALFNELELARAKHAGATAKLKQINAKLTRIKEDERRRYHAGTLGRLYGYICNPEIIMRQGLALLKRTGRADEIGVAQVRRAIGMLSPEERANAELNLLSAFYAAGGDKAKARRLYDDALVRDPTNREAILGLARLELLNGNAEKAGEYVKRLIDAGVDEVSLATISATVKLALGDVDGAKAILRKATDANRSNMEAWSLLAMTYMRQIDSLSGAEPGSDGEATRNALEKELADVIVPTMEKQATKNSDYHLQTIKAFTLMRKGGEENVRGARDAFIVASNERPGVAATSDMILGLDMQLNDTADAERQAVETLDAAPSDPLANYVMGSLALQRGEAGEAEAYLKRSVAGERKIPLALNDLAETLRRRNALDEAEMYARAAVAAEPNLYVAWETLGSILMDAGKGFDEAEQCVQKAVDLSKDANGRPADVRMLITLARVQLKRGETSRAKVTMRSVAPRIGELTEYEKKEFEDLRKSAK